MAVVITQAMINAVGGDATTAVWRVRRLLDAAGVGGVELHHSEIDTARHYQEKARLAAEQAARILAQGPLPPECDCSEDENGLVINVTRCRWGHLSGRPKFGIEAP